MKYLAAIALISACAAQDAADDMMPDEETPGGDLGLGDVSADDMKADGNWGHALECKPVPMLTPLAKPRITLSIDGLTLHLHDDATGFDKVYPVGPGQIEQDPNSGDFGESHSYWPVAHYARNDFQITPSTIQPCKTWWTDPATGAKSPVFAGLPFMSFSGNYAIHGPIDNYRAANGGNLRRGYVSHGCFRMEAADVVEVYALIKGVAKVPVRLQREPEKTVEGVRVDIAKKWIGSQCSANSECNFTGGFCATNSLTQKGFCSARCTTTCSDRAGSPTTFCVADPNTAGQGMCVAKAQSENFECRPYDHFSVSLSTPRFNNAAVKANVCMPNKARGWVGDHCRIASDCSSGTTCLGATASKPGTCSMTCNKFCADQPGYADTFCATAPSLATTGSCLRQCTPTSNASECPSDTTCSSVARFDANRASTVPPTMKNVCLPN